MSTFAYKDVAEIIHASEFGEDWILQFNAMDINEIFTCLNDLLVKAEQETNIEDQLILYLRCGELSKIISTRKEFSAFTQKEALSKLFGHSCERITFLINKLDHLYTVKVSSWSSLEESRGHSVTNSNQVIVLPVSWSIPDTSNSPLLITPIEFNQLIRKPLPLSALIRNPRLFSELLQKPLDILSRIKKSHVHSVVILDIRSDQSKFSLSLPSHFDVTVIPVNREIIVKGLTFSTVVQGLPSSSRSRTALEKETTKVVILDDNKPPIVKAEIYQKSKVALLAEAFHKYNKKESPQRPVYCIAGGFERLKAEFPVYIENLVKEEPKENDYAIIETVPQQIPCSICYEAFPSELGFVCAGKNCRRALCQNCYQTMANDASQSLCAFCRTTFNYIPIIIPRID